MFQHLAVSEKQLANSLTVSENDKTESPFEMWGPLRNCNFRAGESLEKSLFTNVY
jgi:hypothetical protein